MAPRGCSAKLTTSGRTAATSGCSYARSMRVRNISIGSRRRCRPSRRHGPATPDGALETYLPFVKLDELPTQGESPDLYPSLRRAHPDQTESLEEGVLVPVRRARPGTRRGVNCLHATASIGAS